MNAYKRKSTAGFSLVELMVGVAIGLVTVLVVLQVMQVAEAKRRESSSGSDAIVNASLGLYAMERDGKNAGYGLTSVRSSMGCEVRAKDNTGAASTFTLTPVLITDGAGGLPDSIRFIASNNIGVTLPTRISLDYAAGGAAFFVESDLGVQSGDMMIAVPATLNSSSPATTWCSLFQVAGTSGGQNQIPHLAGSSLWNHAGTDTIMPATYLTGDYLLNLGSFSDHTYSIQNNMLRMREIVLATNVTNNIDLFPHVVQLQAVYGKDTSAPSDNIVDVWESTAPTTAAQWQQVRAVRLALVARSQTPETGNVTLDGSVAASTCDSATPHPAAVCWRPDPGANGVRIDVNVANANPDWQRYRYRVMETTIPIRNMIWQQ